LLSLALFITLGKGDTKESEIAAEKKRGGKLFPPNFPPL